MIRDILTEFLRKKYKRSYSQCGEDLIMEHLLLNFLKVDSISYLDIGAHQPDFLSNTYYFYKMGYSGVCVEPHPVLFQSFSKKRERDICLNVGVGTDNNRSADFFIMSWLPFSTFSKEKAMETQNYNPKNKIEKVISIPMNTINEILSKYFQKSPELVSMDIEGWDLKIMKTWDFSKFRPKVFCIETLLHDKRGKGNKDNELINFMLNNGYYLYADTFINSIFVDRKEIEQKVTIL